MFPFGGLALTYLIILLSIFSVLSVGKIPVKPAFCLYSTLTLGGRSPDLSVSLSQPSTKCFEFLSGEPMVLVLGLPSKSPGKHLKNLKKKFQGLMI